MNPIPALPSCSKLILRVLSFSGLTNYRVVLLRITSTDEGNAELISVGSSPHCEGYLVVIAQAVEEEDRNLL